MLVSRTASTIASTTTKTTTSFSINRCPLEGSASFLAFATDTTSTKAMPVSRPETVKRKGRRGVFHSGTPGADMSRMPV